MNALNNLDNFKNNRCHIRKERRVWHFFYLSPVFPKGGEAVCLLKKR